MFTATQLATWTSARWTLLPADGTLLAGFSTDTRTLRPGEIFVALRTPQRDGHDYLAAARAAGAPAALVASPSGDPALAGFPQLVVSDPLAAFQTIAREHRRAFRRPVVGITGSAGKTSTKNLLTLLLSADPGDVLSTEGNLNNHLGVPLTLTRLDPARHRFAVVEAGISAPGEMAALAAMIEPDVAIITLVAPAHLEALRDLETIAREKSVLFNTLRPGGLALRGPGVPPATWHGHPAHEVARASSPCSEGVPPAPFAHATFHTPATTAISIDASVYELPRVTDGMARNAALAIRAALHLGISPADIRSRLTRWQPVPLRGEWQQLPVPANPAASRPVYLDCYNANPASMLDALATFAATAAPADAPRLYLVGGMEELGPGSARHHEALGRALATHLRPQDHLVAIGPHAETVTRAASPEKSSSPPSASHIHAHPDSDAARSAPATAALLATHSGPVFVKGSRRHALERLVFPARTPNSSRTH
ncbi:UDP-N-acetylmuramoylalanyl-D-glutamate--2,6-diaminopimelate ligase [Opitutaceae bacterium TAV5]|nr:UDP-N-acetylmuramoylalanyl-D-glutamate--2,6-diaminopimelate ligase [Opitutaceae bacterium TAV5]